MSSTVNESKWVYYKDGSSFKTKAEQIFNNVEATDLFEDHVNLSWTPGAEVTHITYANANDAENIQTINLTDAERQLVNILLLAYSQQALIPSLSIRMT